MKPEIKKQIILHLPYLAFIYLFGKVGQAFRLAQGADISAKLLHIGQGFSAAFASAAPSFHPTDLLIGLAAAVIIRLVVYSKQKNAKKYRKGMEYGTARWGTAADIKPFIDPVFDNNVLLTQTERLMMSNRPKDPKNARNKNTRACKLCLLLCDFQFAQLIVHYLYFSLCTFLVNIYLLKKERRLPLEGIVSKQKRKETNRHKRAIN